MSQPSRLPEGGIIDRSCELSFSFDGRPLTGYAGDTLASALLANGVRMVSRSFKYHRPRGIYSAGDEEPNALVSIGTGARREPNARATRVPLEEGLVAASQNCWPSLSFDLGRLFDYSHALWPAGFYNKTFKWPGWRFWEPMIRRVAGLGLPLTEPDPDRYEAVNAHCDLLICGGGPAGLAAALVAGRAGLRVILAEQDGLLGGSLNHERVQLDGEPGRVWVDAVVQELSTRAEVMLLPATTVSGLYDHNVATLVQRGTGTAWRECQWTVRPRAVLLATGAIEQGLIFPDNDRPGVMLAGAARHYLNRHAVAAGRRVVVATNNDSAYRTALDMHARHIDVVAVVDSRPGGSSAYRDAMQERGIRCLDATHIAGTTGTRAIRRVAIRQGDGEPALHFDCDLLAVSGGWAPRVHLFSHARGGLRFDERSQRYLPDRLPPELQVAGSANGRSALAAAIKDGAEKATAIAERLGRASAPFDPPERVEEVAESDRVEPLSIRPGRGRQWIDLAHDVTVSDAELSVREGFESVEHFKRYTTTGMSVDQGKTGNVNAFVALGELTGRSPGEVGTTTFRPPYAPVTLGTIAGRNLAEHFAPRRFLPAHTVHSALGAAFQDYGWQRPDAYPRAGESLHAAIHREARAVRESVGVFDNSPIGKIEVRGTDAAAFLNRVYVNDVPGLPVGRARYGLMLNEHGVIVDDGVFVRWNEDRFVLHPTSGNAARIAATLEEWLQCEWSDLNAVVDDVTTQWANLAVAGPRARDVVAAVVSGADLSVQALPHMAVTTGVALGSPVWVCRVSYSGEPCYEITIRAGLGGELLEALLEAGAGHDITPFGVEALMILRLEKGYLHVGSDTDGSTTPDDVGWGRVARTKRGDYIGKRSLLRPANQSPHRMQLVGLEPADDDRPIRAGAHLLLGAGRTPPAPSDGWVTSAAYSPNLERHIALGVLKGGLARHGERVTAVDGRQRYPLRVVRPAFFDPDNQRLLE